MASSTASVGAPRTTNSPTSRSSSMSTARCGVPDACVEPQCDRPVKVKARGLCNRHYLQVQRAGCMHLIKKPRSEPGTSAADLAKYVLERCKRQGECLVWVGKLTHDGYGVLYGARNVYLGVTHRIAYEGTVGPVPEELEVDHLCRVRNCANPEHLEPVPRSENIRRAKALITACPQGHEYTPENTYWSQGRRRSCRTCNRASVARYKERRRA